MNERIAIRQSEDNDWPEIERLYSQAFPDEALLPLVKALLSLPDLTLSLVAVEGSSVIGHIILTTCGIDDRNDQVALLAPLGVVPSRQKTGIGSALIQAGFDRLKKSGLSQICVLGDPGYYGRFGFRPETQVAPPYPLPEEWAVAWQSLSLGSAAPLSPGTLTVPTPWRQPTLWAP